MNYNVLVFQQKWGSEVERDWLGQVLHEWKTNILKTFLKDCFLGESIEISDSKMKMGLLTRLWKATLDGVKSYS